MAPRSKESDHVSLPGADHKIEHETWQRRDPTFLTKLLLLRYIFIFTEDNEPLHSKLTK